MNDIFFFFTRISETRNVNEDEIGDRKGKRNSRKERSANDSECVDRG